MADKRVPILRHPYNRGDLYGRKRAFLLLNGKAKSSQTSLAILFSKLMTGGWSKRRRHVSTPPMYNPQTEKTAKGLVCAGVIWNMQMTSDC